MKDENKSKQVWERFQESFIKHIKECKTDAKKRLADGPDRKYFLGDLFLKMQNDLALGYNKIYPNEKESEFLKVDYTFFKHREKQWAVPIIGIESENNWETIEKECLKLCSLNAPLKILILYELNDERVNCLEKEENDWDYILKDFSNEYNLVGYFVVMVYTLDGDQIKFHTYVYDESAKQIKKEILTIE